MTWQPPKLRVRPWWRFWEQPEWEEPEPVFPAFSDYQVGHPSEITRR